MPRINTWNDIFSLPFTDAEFEKARKVLKLKTSELNEYHEIPDHIIENLKWVMTEIRVDNWNKKKAKKETKS